MVEIDPENVTSFLGYLGYGLKDGKENTYFKKYQKASDYEIEIKINTSKFSDSKIDYGNEIKYDSKTTQNFSQQENFVVLECVNRLLDKGYLPESIYLEKRWRLGHRGKGGLDIFVLDANREPFLMIECKTWDKEFRKEKEKVLYKDGGQLFSYYIQEKKTQYLCLYTSSFDAGRILYENLIIKITGQIRDSSSQREVYENWKPQVYENRGIFESDIKPYLITFSGLRKKDLTPLTEEDGGDIFNRFAEILRRNVVSDKTNAYNKIFNLFLCKIVDEYEIVDNDKKMRFQWEESEENETVLLRLNELYKKGMKQYLDLDISSVELDEIDSKLKNLKSDRDKQKIKELFIQQKLYTSNEFAFRELFDKNTFDLNCIVVKEVVNLLEKYQIKYETKQPFLGDFFEKLLNTGIKQEVGQFFTPVPIAQFICKSLPLYDIIQEKNNKEEIFILPYCIDYASGAGHFLTEIMEEINHYVENKIKIENIKNGRAREKFESHKNNYDWAREYIYGIEKDYRLAKTTKIATFLNGDGDAVIICGDGLDNFNKSKDYRGKLSLRQNEENNENFDILVANPPYSVSGFTSTLNHGDESFGLWENFTNKSNEIECLFIERTKQLLREGGVAGIILPTNIIEGGGIYEKTREIIFQNFKIKAIVKLGKNTFMATQTSTIILFIEKVQNRKDEIISYLKKSITEKKDYTVEGIEKPIHKYLENAYKIDFRKYLTFFDDGDEDTENLKRIKIYKAYIDEFDKQKYYKEFSDFLFNKEIEKLYYFVTTYQKKTVLYVVNSNSIKEEKKILGYEFSNRKGYEGIYIFDHGGKLYNPENLEDNEKINYYILKNFGEEELEIEKDIENLHFIDLHEFIDFNSPNFDKSIALNKYDVRKNKTLETAKKAVVKLETEKIIQEGKRLIEEYKKKTSVTTPKIRQTLLKDIETGGTPHTRTQKFWKDGTINWLVIGDMEEKYITKTEDHITMEGKKDKNLTEYKKGTVLFSIFASIGKVGILKIKTTLNQAVCALIPNKDRILTEYLYYILLIERDNIAGGRLHRTQDNLNQTKLAEYEIPLIEDLKIQQEFIDKMKKFEKSIKITL